LATLQDAPPTVGSHDAGSVLQTTQPLRRRLKRANEGCDGITGTLIPKTAMRRSLMIGGATPLV